MLKAILMLGVFCHSPTCTRVPKGSYSERVLHLLPAILVANTASPTANHHHHHLPGALPVPVRHNSVASRLTVRKPSSRSEDGVEDSH